MDLRYWKQFENSGKIEDYLRFAVNSGRERKEEEISSEEEDRQVEEDGHAGTYFFDGNRTEGFSGGRLR